VEPRLGPMLEVTEGEGKGEGPWARSEGVLEAVEGGSEGTRGAGEPGN
jgi:hypothetical protein